MSTTFKKFLLISGLVLWAGAAQAGDLLPLQTGMWTEFKKTDGLGHQWTVRREVLQRVTVGNLIYYNIRQLNRDPYAETSVLVEEFLMRSTETAVYINAGGTEILWCQVGSPGTTWTFPQQNGTETVTIMPDETVTVPYGGPYQAHVYRHHYTENGVNSPYWYSYVVPGLSAVKEVDYRGDPGRPPLVEVQAAMGVNQATLLQTGKLFVYQAFDNAGHNWIMRRAVMEQVVLNNEKYYRVRQTNYDPYENKVQEDLFLRTTNDAVYQFLDGQEVMIYQIAQPVTTWNYPAPGGRVYTTIYSSPPDVPTKFGVLEYYLHRSYLQYPDGSSSPLWYEYISLGFPLMQIVDHRVLEPNRAPLSFWLIQFVGNASGATNLLLLGN
jgi:hypothetical protein